MEGDFKGSRAFLNIPVGIARDKELLKRPKSIILMGEIVSMLNVTGKFFMSNKEIAKRLDCSSRMVANYLAILEDKKLIKRTTIYEDEEQKIIKGRYITAGDDLVKYISLGWGSPLHEGNEAHFTTLVKPVSHKENNIKEQSNRAINNNSSPKVEPIPYKEITDYLNTKTGAHYKPASKANQRLIKARWNEGYRLKDFKTVINNKAFEWQNTDMWKYMRPATLFSASKFDDYLNANNLDKSKHKPTSGGYDTASVPDIKSIPNDDLPF